MRPSIFYIFGFAGSELSSGCYAAAYGVFTYTFLLHGQQPEWFVYVLALKFFFEFAFDISTSMLADIRSKGRWSRRTIFLAGSWLRSVGFALLAMTAWMQPTSELATTVALVVMADFVRALGNACMSGTLDSWAVTLETLDDSDFDKTWMFVAANKLERVAMLLAVTLTCSYLAVSQLAHQGLRGDFVAIFERGTWTYLWSLAAVIHMTVTASLAVSSTGFAMIPYSPSKPARALDAMRAAFDPRSIAAWVLLSAMYTLTMLTTYTWPVLIEPVSHLLNATLNADVSKAALLFAPCALMVAGTAGALTAPRARDAIHNVPRFASRTAQLVLLGGLIILLTVWLQGRLGGSLFAPLAVLTGVASTLLGRFYLAKAMPFVRALVHDNTGHDETIRAAIVSIRFATPNLMVSVSVLGSVFIYRLLQNTFPAKPVATLAIGSSVVAVCLVILAAIAALQRRKHGATPQPLPSGV